MKFFEGKVKGNLNKLTEENFEGVARKLYNLMCDPDTIKLVIKE